MGEPDLLTSNEEVEIDAETGEAIERGLREVEEGPLIPHAEVRERLSELRGKLHHSR
jgi:predicted transcriptional regulator